jgi:hypothetical protein
MTKAKNNLTPLRFLGTEAIGQTSSPDGGLTR